VTAHRLVFAIGPEPFAVLITLVAGHYDHRANALDLRSGGKNMNGAHYVGRISLDWLAIRPTNQGLRRQVKDNLGLQLLQKDHNGLEFTDVAIVATDK